LDKNTTLKEKLLHLYHNFEYILAGVLMVVMMVSLFLQVIFRFVIRHPLGWTEELAVTSFVMMVYVGSIGATRNDEHLKLELVINALGKKGGLILMILGDIVFFIVDLILARGLFLVALNLRKYHMTTAMLHIPKWIPYMVLPVCFLIMNFKLIQNIIKKIRKIRELDAEKTEVSKQE